MKVTVIESHRTEQSCRRRFHRVSRLLLRVMRAKKALQTGEAQEARMPQETGEYSFLVAKLDRFDAEHNF